MRGILLSTLFVLSTLSGCVLPENQKANPTYLIEVIQEPPDPFCTAGSVVTNEGLDDGDPGGIALNEVLESDEIEQTSSQCFSYEIEMVKDISPGLTSSVEPFFSNHLTVMDGIPFFVADDGVSGKELWKSDGTESGTMLVKDISPGSHGSSPHELTVLQTSNGPILFFAATDPVNGTELWKSDGTEAGTVMVKDINPGGTLCQYPSSSPSQLTATSFDTLFFSARDCSAVHHGSTPYHGYELWKSDGTEAGTVMVQDVHSGSASSYPKHLIMVENTLYFQATNGSGGNGTELWKSDGTTLGTVEVKDIHPGVMHSVPLVQGAGSIGPTLYFAPVIPEGLWKSDGTESGTVLVKNLNFYGGNPNCTGCADWPNGFVHMDGFTYFVAEAPGVYGHGLWRSDGTETGTTLVASIPLHMPADLTVVGDSLYFSAHTWANGRELWKSDGTTLGTVEIKDINPEVILQGAMSSNPSVLTGVGDIVYFTAYSNSTGIYGYELWRSDGTSSGTWMVKGKHLNTFNHVNEIAVGSCTFTCQQTTSWTIYFTARDNTHGTELWQVYITQIEDPNPTLPP